MLVTRSEPGAMVVLILMPCLRSGLQYLRSIQEYSMTQPFCKASWRRVIAPPCLAVVTLLSCQALVTGEARAQAALPISPNQKHPPQMPTIPEPRDVAYPGDVRITVDATDVLHRVFKIHESLPVRGGSTMTLLFPQWTTGDHTPNGPIDRMAGLRMSAGGAPLAWHRDPVQMYAFHVEIPQDVMKLEVDYQFLSPFDSRSGAVLMNPTMLDLQWQTAVLYPAGYYSRDVWYRPTVVLPDGWQYVSALDGPEREGSAVSFRRVALETLVDSPVMAAKYMKQVTVSAGPHPVRLNVAAETPEQLEGLSVVATDYAKITNQAYKLFGSRHYDHYDFMLWLSDDFGPVYYEHHRSGENSGPANFLSKYPKSTGYRAAMLHGYVHSWNGTFRRPAEMCTPNFNLPERDSLLWIFEGLTMYWQDVLATRAGLGTAKEEIDSLAVQTARALIDRGAEWRPFEDVGYSAVFSFRKAEPWGTWQRGMFDAYNEGELLWLEIDLILRAQSHGQRSLDDFARSFFGMNDGSFATLPYSLEDVKDALRAVVDYDWDAFFEQRLQGLGQGVSLSGLELSGYRLVFADAPETDEGGGVDLTFSIGMIVDAKGVINSVRWAGPAYGAGAAPNQAILTVNGAPFTPQGLRDAVRAATTSQPVTLTVKAGSTTPTLTIAWHDGLRTPHMEHDGTGPAPLEEIFRSRE